MSEPGRRWEKHVDAALGLAASALLLCLMCITFVDVVARYLFNFPLRGGFEVTELMLLVLIFAGLPLVSHADEHVTMDFIDRMLPPRAVMLVVRAAHALCAAVMFFLTWQVCVKAATISGYGDTTDVLKILVGPFVYFMAAMILLTGVVHLYKMVVPGAARASQATT